MARIAFIVDKDFEDSEFRVPRAPRSCRPRCTEAASGVRGVRAQLGLQLPPHLGRE
jgi:hypothetical protein